MITNQKLDKSFGPIGVVAGITLFLVGIALVYFSLSGLFLILLSAFVGFTSTSTLIDIEKKRVKFSTNWFGIISTGKWVDITTGMKLGIKKSKKTWRAYSRGNRSIDMTDSDYRLILFNSENIEIVPIMKTESLESAKKEVEELCRKLEISIN